jgi:hypothetical protein
MDAARVDGRGSRILFSLERFEAKTADGQADWELRTSADKSDRICLRRISIQYNEPHGSPLRQFDFTLENRTSRARGYIAFPIASSYRS